MSSSINGLIKMTLEMTIILLSFMRHIGRTWTLDNIKEANGISIYVN